MGKQGIVHRRIRPWIPVILIYFGFVMIRFILAWLTTAYPTVGIDEFLYYSLGRSIATEGRLLYRGQPALYNYFIYPLFLSPVYLLFPAGSDFYRIIQCWNGILMNLAIFPIFGLCRTIFKDQKKALMISATFLLLPDFSLSEFIFSEAVIYPLFFLLVYLVYLSLKEQKYSRFILMGILGTVLYFTKPGAVVPAIVGLLFFMIRGLIRKEKKEIMCSLSGIGAFTGSFFLLWAIVRFVFGYQGTLLSVYHEQLETEGKMFWDVFLQTLVCYPYYFSLACGVVPAVVLVARFRSFDRTTRNFYGVLLICLAVLMVGTAWTINRSEHTHILFLRYIAMYIPLVFMGCLILAENKNYPDWKDKKLSLFGILLSAYLAICTAVWGSTVGTGEYIENHFQVSLAILVQPNIKGISDIIIFLLSGFAVYLLARKMNEKTIIAICCGVFALSAVINNIGGYVATGSNAIQKYGEEAYAAQRNLIRGDEYLYLFSSDTKTTDHGLNIYSKHNDQQLEWFDFFNNIHEHGGAYAPFVPVSERGMNEGGTTPDVNVLVAEKTTYPLIKFSENIQGTITEHGSFYVGRFESGARIIDAMIANMENFKLLRTDYGVLTIYRDDWLNHPVKITLNIESPVTQNMRFFADDDHSWNIELQAGQYAYEIRIPEAAIGYNFVIDQADIMVYGFDIEAWEE